MSLRQTARPHRLPLIAGLILVATLSGCEPPPRSTAVFLLDSSASSARFREEAIATVRGVAMRMEPRIDRLVVYRLSQTTVPLYEGDPDSDQLQKTLDTYATTKPEEFGTAYGDGFRHALADVAAASDSAASVVAFLGDGADERVRGGGNIDWPWLENACRELPGHSRLAMLYLDEGQARLYRDRLKPVLGDRLNVMLPTQAAGIAGVNQICEWLHR